MLTTICAIAFTFTNLTAQDAFDMKVAEPSLLKHSSVQKELNMSAAQISSVEKTQNEMFAKFKARSSWSTEEYRDAVNRLLGADQLKRLREITLQDSGPVTLMVDEVARKVGLSKEEQKQVQRTFEQNVEELMAPVKQELERLGKEVGKQANGNPEEARRLGKELSEKARAMTDKIDREKMHHGADAKILANLSPTQRKVWEDLLGKPFPVESLRKAK